MKQLTIKFPSIIEKEFDESFYIGNRLCYTRRENGETFLNVGGLNFLGKYSGPMIRFFTGKIDSYGGCTINRLKELSLEEIKAFARNVVRMQEDGESTWDTIARKSKFVFNAGEKYSF